MASLAVRLALVLVAISLVNAACSGDDDPDGGAGGDAGEPGVVLPAPTTASDGEPVPTPGRVGVEVARTELAPGDCFNEYHEATGSTGLVGITTAVDCTREHHAEVYAATTHPAPAGEPFPGADEMDGWAQDFCYGAFSDFVGIDYELSILEIGTVVPDIASWELGPYRGVQCYVYSPGAALRGTMRGSQN